MEHNRVIYTRPYDAEVEYLESTGTQRINTCVCNYGIDVQFTKFTQSGQAMGWIYYNDTKSSRFGIFNNSINRGNSSISNLFPSNNVYRVQINNDTLIVNGVIQSTSLSDININKSWHFILFARKDYRNNSIINYANTKIYYCKLYDKNNTLIRDFIPVRVGSVGYMYDKVSGKLFGNKGTGNFILGPDVANPVPNIRRVFRFDNKRFVIHMPYDSKIEYLESTGIQYIYIPFTLNKGDNAYCSVYVTDTELTNGNVIFMSSTDSRNKYGLSILNRKMWLVAFANSEVSGQDIYYDYNVWRNVSIIYNANENKYIFNVDNTNLTSQTPAYNSVSGIYLFCRNNLLEHAAKARISSLKIKRNGNYILDLIPVRKDNVGYMYDRVSGKLFGNSGTGQFILGNDIN